MKRKILFSAALLWSITMISGCTLFGTDKGEKLAEPPVSDKIGVPAEQKDPAPAIPPAEADPAPANPEKKSEEEVKKPAVTEKESALVPPGEKSGKPEKVRGAVPPPSRPRSPENYRRGPGLWRAFTRLPREEQQKLLQLQRSDPERYRKIMHEKADQLYSREAARRQELEKLAEKIRNSDKAAEKEALKTLLREKVKEDFRQRLQDTRRDIEAYKRRTARLEMELSKREKNCDAIVEVILNRHLEGKPPVSPPPPVQ